MKEATAKKKKGKKEKRKKKKQPSTQPNKEKIIITDFCVCHNSRGDLTY